MTHAFARQALPWIAFAGALIVLPFALHGDFALSVASKMGIGIIFALSYNMLLGQGGMLSFGHAVYSGLGAYFAIHALAAVARHGIAFPVSLLPLVGGLAGLACAVLLGYVTTRRAGTTFAMISLGIGELVAACVLMIPAFFGGEAGVSADRVTGTGWFGINFASQRQMYYLIAAWTLASTGLMYFITRTPFGRLANAVRDNPERVAFIGYSTHLLRYQLMMVAGFFAGVSGGLAALNNEIVTVEAVGAHASGVVLLMVFIGGIGQFYGPIIGTVVVTLLQTVVSTFTHAWQFYFGLLFLAMVLFAPGGFASLVVLHAPLLRAPRVARPLLPGYAIGLIALAMLLSAAVIGVETAYRLVDSNAAPQLTLAGFTFEIRSMAPWLAVGALVVAGGALMRFAWLRAHDAWSRIGGELRNAAAIPRPQAALAGATR